MDEKRFIEILENNNKKIFERFDKIDQKFEQVDKRFDQIDKKFAQIDEKFDQIDKKFAQIDEKFDQIDKRFDQMDKKFDQIDERFAQIDKRIDDLETKIIDNGCYFEVTYGQKIDAIFTKLQMNEEISIKDKQDYERFKKRFEHNDTILASHDFRIQKLEQQVNAGNF